MLTSSRHDHQSIDGVTRTNPNTIGVGSRGDVYEGHTRDGNKVLYLPNSVTPTYGLLGCHQNYAWNYRRGVDDPKSKPNFALVSDVTNGQSIMAAHYQRTCNLESTGS